MPLFSDKTYEKAHEAETKTIGVPFQENMYLANINEIEHKADADEWDTIGGVWQRTGKTCDKLLFHIILEKPIDGEELLDIKGGTPKYNSITVWVDPTRLGYTKNGAREERLLITAAMNWDVDADLNIAILEDLYESKKLINKKLKVYVKVSEKKDGTKINKVSSYIPYVEKE